MCPNSDNPTEGRWLHGSSNQCIYITTISPTTASVTDVAEVSEPFFFFVPFFLFRLSLFWLSTPLEHCLRHVCCSYSEREREREREKRGIKSVRQKTACFQLKFDWHEWIKRTQTTSKRQCKPTRLHNFIYIYIPESNSKFFCTFI